MFGFGRKKQPVAQLKTSIGTFRFDGTSWMTDPSDEIVLVSVGSDLNVDSIDRAQAVLRRIEEYRALALSYARSNGSGLWDTTDEPELESIEITDVLEDRFGLTFGFESEPDLTLNVEFNHGQPCEVWAAD